MIDFFRYYKLELMACFILCLIIGLISLVIYVDYEHNKKWKCIKGHYEDVWITTVDGNGYPTGGYFMETWNCDEEVLRDSTIIK